MKSRETYFAQARNYFLFSFILFFLLIYTEACEKESLDKTQLAEVMTMEAFDLSTNSFKTGGFILDDGGVEIISWGVCWDTLPNPSIENNKLEMSLGDKTFTALISGLNDGTRYYIRA